MIPTMGGWRMACSVGHMRPDRQRWTEHAEKRRELVFIIPVDLDRPRPRRGMNPDPPVGFWTRVADNATDGIQSRLEIEHDFKIDLGMLASGQSEGREAAPCRTEGAGDLIMAVLELDGGNKRRRGPGLDQEANGGFLPQLDIGCRSARRVKQGRAENDRSGLRRRRIGGVTPPESLGEEGLSVNGLIYCRCRRRIEGGLHRGDRFFLKV